jgi:hypothetical protein
MMYVCFDFFHKANATTNFPWSDQAFNKVTSLEAFTATKFNEMFAARQLRQDVKVCGHCRNWLNPHLQGSAGGLVQPKLITRCATLCCVYLCWAWVQDEMWPLWLVGVDKRSLNLVWAVYCWNALHNQLQRALDKCHEHLTIPNNQMGHNPSCTQVQHARTQHRVGHLVISFSSATPPATPW